MSTDPWDTGGPMSARAGGRMTPRVPLAGAVSGQGGLAPRAPHNGGSGSSRGGGSSRHGAHGTPTAYRGGLVKQYSIDTTALGSLPKEKMFFLAKKLVHLSILLEQDTVTEDFRYPSFHGGPQ